MKIASLLLRPNALTLPRVTVSLLRRVSAAVAVVLFLLGSVVTPAVHLSEHGSGLNAVDVDIESLKDPQTGRVDLTRLAIKLGLGEHDESRPHRHGPGPEGHHGDGSLEHFGLALASGAAVLAAPLSAPFELVVRPLPSEHSRVPALDFLSAQRAQAPPA